MITTVTLNASVDKAYYMDNQITCGKVMRVSSCINSAGGKGLNVARIIKLCKEDVCTTGLVGGFNGMYLESMLKNDQISYNFEHVKAETRSCINILDSKYGSTEFLEPGSEISPEEIDHFMKRFEDIIDSSELITISGSVPKGIDYNIYQKMIERVKAKDKKVILDTSGELLKNGILAKPTMVKPNQDEIEMLFDIKINNIGDVIYYAKEISKQGIPYVVVSLGGEGALLVCGDSVYHSKPPKINVVNTVGCGDSMVGAFAVAFSRNYPPKQALAYAIAVASANALSLHTGHFDPKVCEEILKEVKVSEL